MPVTNREQQSVVNKPKYLVSYLRLHAVSQDLVRLTEGKQLHQPTLFQVHTQKIHLAVQSPDEILS